MAEGFYWRVENDRSQQFYEDIQDISGYSDEVRQKKISNYRDLTCRQTFCQIALCTHRDTFVVSECSRLNEMSPLSIKSLIIT